MIILRPPNKNQLPQMHTDPRRYQDFDSENKQDHGTMMKKDELERKKILIYPSLSAFIKAKNTVLPLLLWLSSHPISVCIRGKTSFVLPSFDRVHCGFADL
jgi:hypothetical protein